jgi:hypothetical protein
LRWNGIGAAVADEQVRCSTLDMSCIKTAEKVGLTSLNLIDPCSDFTSKLVRYMYKPNYDMMLKCIHIKPLLSEDGSKHPGYKTNFAGWLHLIYKLNFNTGMLRPDIYLVAFPATIIVTQ